MLKSQNISQQISQYSDNDEQDDEKKLEVLSRSIVNLFEQYVKLNKKVPPEVLTSLAGIDDPSRLSDTIAAHMSLKLEEKQHVLEIVSTYDRLEHLMNLIEAELDVLQIEKRIRGRVKTANGKKPARVLS